MKKPVAIFFLVLVAEALDFKSAVRLQTWFST